jgi:hypothetical protein
VDPRAGLDNLVRKKFLTLPGLELRPLGPARSHGKSLKLVNYMKSYWLSDLPKVSYVQIISDLQGVDTPCLITTGHSKIPPRLWQKNPCGVLLQLGSNLSFFFACFCVGDEPWRHI